MGPVIGIENPFNAAKTDWHASCDPGANYDTLCGVSLSDDPLRSETAKRGQKITCAHCYNIWKLAHEYSPGQFAFNLRSKR